MSTGSRRSLVFALTVILLVISTAVFGTLAVVGFRTIRLRETRALEHQASIQAQTLAEALSLPIWNLDEAQVDRILASTMGDRATVGLRIQSPDFTRSLFRSGVTEAPTGTLMSQGLSLVTREIRRNDTVLGRLEIFSTHSYLEMELKHLRMILTGGLLIFDLILVLAASMLIWRIVVQPVRDLEHFAVAVASGSRPGPLGETKSGFRELSSMRQSIMRMVSIMDERYQNLMASEQRFRTLFHGSNDAIFLREIRPDDPSAPFVEVNDAACRVLGYSREELLGMNSFDLEPDPGNVITARAALQNDGTCMFRGQHRTKDGRILSVEVNAHRFTLSGRDFVLSVARDLTERNRLEEQLRHSQKMESVGLLAGGIAHDFNNILQVILGFGSSLQEAMNSEEPQARWVQRIMAAANRASQLTRSLLAFSRKDVLKPRPAELNALVARMDEFLKRIIGEDIDLETRWYPEPLNVVIDEGQIEQVLMNLATNARDAMPRGGILRIETQRIVIGADEHQLHGLATPGLYARILVSDNGQGMNETTRNRIFDPFFTTKDAGKGTGLGLSIVYNIIRQHQGAIMAYSELGSGTSFRIYLPLSGDAPGGTVESHEAPPVGGSETILLAEDEGSVRELMQSVLEAWGYRVLLASNGQEAVDCYRAHAGSVDLLLFDLVMPQKSGKQAYDEIREEWPTARVLFTSGYTADIIRSRGELAEGAELALKPITPAQLLRQVRALLDAGPA